MAVGKVSKCVLFRNFTCEAGDINESKDGRKAIVKGQ